MQISIRRAQPEDADILTNLSMRSKQSNGYDDTLMAAFRDELIITKELLINYECWVAESGLVCGFIVLRKEANNTGEVYALFVEPEWKRLGIGKLLWHKLQDHAKAKGLASLHLDADPFAVSFYEAMGFKTIGEAPSGSIPGRTLPHMEFILG